MIYTNRVFRVEIREMAFGPLAGIALGERGRGRSEIFIPTPEGVEEISAGMTENLSIGRTRSGRCRIVRGNIGFSAVLSSEGGYTRRGNGSISSLAENPANTLETAMGADGAAGRIGFWSAKILEMPPAGETIIRVRRGGGNPSDLVRFDGYEFKFIPNSEIELFWDHLDNDMPFSFEGRKFKQDEWV